MNKKLDLTEGLLLEDTGELFKWGMDRDEAWKIGSPMPYNFPEDRTRIKWKCKALAGLNCGILAYLPDGTGLEELEMWLEYENDRQQRDAMAEYIAISTHINNLIGSPYKAKPAGGAILAPILTWKLDGCNLQLYTGDRFGEFTLLQIAHGRKPHFE